MSIYVDEYKMTNQQENFSEDDLFYILFKTHINFKHIISTLLIYKYMEKFINDNMDKKINIIKLDGTLSRFPVSKHFKKLRSIDEQIRVIEYFDSIGLQYLNIDEFFESLKNDYYKKFVLCLKFYYNEIINESEGLYEL